jgi:hypothetical protein
VQDILIAGGYPPKIKGMKKFRFKDVIDEAVKPYPKLLRPDGHTINFSALARHYKDKGHPVQNSTLWAVNWVLLYEQRPPQ